MIAVFGYSMFSNFKHLSFVLLLLTAVNSFAQGKKAKVLFLGNSYTHVNNMPQIAADLAASLGDTLIFEMEAPGGYTLPDHYTSMASKNKIKQGGWDYVVLQEQSQVPAKPQIPHITQMRVYAYLLDTMIDYYNPCANTIFYMTWGRKNGDANLCAQFGASWPAVCTYIGMDSLIRLRYLMVTDTANASTAPAGPIWRYIRNNYPSIELYDADESHPSPAGSYAAACAMYVAIFKRSPLASTYNFSLSATDAANIRTAAKAVAYDSMSTWSIGVHELSAGFNFTKGPNNQVNFNNTSNYATIYNWDFGDGQTSTQQNPVHTYSAVGIYKTRLIASNPASTCVDTTEQLVNLYPANIGNVTSNPVFSLYPNPARNSVQLIQSIPAGVELTIRITDNLGKLIYSQKTSSSGPVSLDISTLKNGVYFVSVTGESGHTAHLRLLKY